MAFLLDLLSHEIPSAYPPSFSHVPLADIILFLSYSRVSPYSRVVFHTLEYMTLFNIPGSHLSLFYRQTGDTLHSNIPNNLFGHPVTPKYGFKRCFGLHNVSYSCNVVLTHVLDLPTALSIPLVRCFFLVQPLRIPAARFPSQRWVVALHQIPRRDGDTNSAKGHRQHRKRKAAAAVCVCVCLCLLRDCHFNNAERTKMENSKYIATNPDAKIHEEKNEALNIVFRGLPLTRRQIYRDTTVVELLLGKTI